MAAVVGTTAVVVAFNLGRYWLGACAASDKLAQLAVVAVVVASALLTAQACDLWVQPALGSLAVLVALNSEVACGAAQVLATAAVALAFQLTDTCRPRAVLVVAGVACLVAVWRRCTGRHNHARVRD